MDSNQLGQMIEQDVNKLKSEMETLFHQTYPQALDEYQAIPIREILADFLDNVRQLIEESEPQARSNAGLEALMALNALQAQLDYLTARINLPVVVNKIGQTVTNAWNGVKNYMQSIIGKLSTNLGKLLAKLLKPKEWSASGSAGVSLFGLAGNAEIQITFGRK